jgi:hypothetical protein
MAKSALYPWLPEVSDDQIDKANKLLDLMNDFADATEMNPHDPDDASIAKYKKAHAAVFAFAMDLTTYSAAKSGE